MRLRRRLALVALLGLAGCGGLETPHLATGSIEGQVVGARVDAFAYPLGHPELATVVAGDGSFRLDALPAGTTRLVVYDDTLPDGTRRAELVELQVPGAGVARFQRNGERAPVEAAARMAWAGAVVASVSPEGGGLPPAPRFRVDGTTLAGSPPAGSGAVQLGLLPAAAGVFELSVEVDGYRAASRPIDVASASNGFDLPVAIETGGTGPRGCAAGGGCVNGLRCQADSGRCVQCLADPDCGAGSSCDPATSFCAAPVGAGDGAVCASCRSDSQCRGGMLNPGWCELAPGASSGFCTWAPISTSYCPAGFSLSTDASGDARCLPATSCAAYFAKFGQGCFGDDGCRAGGALPVATCMGADPVGGQPGYCTAECRLLATPADSCVVQGYHCDPGLKRCLRD